MSFKQKLPETINIIEKGMDLGLHIGAQGYVWLDGQKIADFALGSAAPKQQDHAPSPMTTDTLMPWLSAGKPVTAIAVAQLLDKNLLSLDDPVAEYIPDFAQHGKDKITVRHLLTHTAGIRAAPYQFPSDSWEKIISTICAVRPEPNWDAGQKAGYHPHTSWFLLGEIVRLVSKEDFSSYMRTHIFKPAGMNDSWAGMSKKRYDDYGRRIGILANTKGSFPSAGEFNLPEQAVLPFPSAGVRGPAHDLGRFYQMLLAGGMIEGKRILSEKNAALFTSRQRIGQFDKTFKCTVDWGLGFIMDSKQYAHGAPVSYGYGPFASPETFGHGGSQSTAALADPTCNLVIVITCNGMCGEKKHQQRMDEILGAVYKDVQLV